MVIRFICWRPSSSGTALPAPVTGPPVGSPWAPPPVGAATRPARTSQGGLSPTLECGFPPPARRMSGARFNDLVGHLREVLVALPDRRQGKNTSYSMADFGLSAFAVFFTQSPSFLAHQKAMQQARGHNNAESFFHLQAIPSDNQIRQTLDPVPPQALYPVYDRIYDTLREQGILQTFRGVHDSTLI